MFLPWLGKNAKMKTKLTTLLALVLCVAAGLCVLVVTTSSSSAPPPINPAQTIRLNILQMLQNKAPIKVLTDIPGGAGNANNRDAAYFAWQEFIALNWPNVAVTGIAKKVGDPGARETADRSKKFGQSPTGVTGTSYPALVWESTRHRAEIFTGTDVQPKGYTTTASDSWGYNSLPGYVYPGSTIVPATSAITPFVNLDEGSQIGTCQMFLKGKEVLFMAKANYMEYGYVASRGWYNSSLLTSPAATPTPFPGSPTNPVANFANTSGYIVTKRDFPAPGLLDGSTTTGKGPGSYVSFPNGTLEFKAAFRIATDEERQAYESGKPIPGGYHAAPIRYYRQPDPKVKTFEYVDTVGVLLSLHIIHKTPSAPYFIFATFEHKDDIVGTDGTPVEDADGTLQDNAFMPSPAASPPPPYVYPSAGPSPSPGKYLVDATTPNVFEYPSQFSAGSVTLQQFIPSPSTNAGPISTTQSSYQNIRNGSPSTLPAGNSPSLSDSYITVNRRRFSIPSNPIVAVNKDIHNLIRMYGYKNPGGTSGIVPPGNVWLNYKLVNVQWIPAGTSAQKTAGKLYAGASIPVESYYLSNSLVETNMILSAFSGQFNGGGDGFSITDFYYPQNPPVQKIAATYTNYNVYVNGKAQTINKYVGDPFYNIYTKGVAYNMGGCMGCHGNTAVNGGSDASFILGHGSPFVIDGIDPAPSTMQERFRSYFRKKN